MVTTTHSACVPLARLGVGQCATLHASALESGPEGALDAGEAQVLRAMGLRPECTLKVCKKGEPCIVSVNRSGCRIALTRRLADRVLVMPA